MLESLEGTYLPQPAQVFKMPPIAEPSKQLIFRRVHWQLPFSFAWGPISFFSFALPVIIKPNCRAPPRPVSGTLATRNEGRCETVSRFPRKTTVSVNVCDKESRRHPQSNRPKRATQSHESHTCHEKTKADVRLRHACHGKRRWM